PSFVSAESAPPPPPAPPAPPPCGLRSRPRAPSHGRGPLPEGRRRAADCPANLAVKALIACCKRASPCARANPAAACPATRTIPSSAACFRPSASICLAKLSTNSAFWPLSAFFTF
ncbi:unnamed protein product, partial [Ectocarpus fasciculatus]